MVNLCKCSPGDYLITRSGFVYIYSHYREKLDTMCPHVAVLNTLGLYESFTDDGKFCISEGPGKRDIVKIIPQETPNIYFNLYENIQFLKRTSAIAKGGNRCLF